MHACASISRCVSSFEDVSSPVRQVCHSIVVPLVLPFSGVIATDIGADYFLQILFLTSMFMRENGCARLVSVELLSSFQV
jgi:hypothetical protein